MTYPGLYHTLRPDAYESPVSRTPSLFAPAPGEVKPNNRSGIIAWHFEPSDDGKFALVEFVAVNKAALARLIPANAPGVVLFERGKSKREDIEKAFKALRKKFRSGQVCGEGAVRRAAALFVLACAGAFGQHYEGWVDGANCSAIFGWAWNWDIPNTPIQVDVYSDGLPAMYPTLLQDSNGNQIFIRYQPGVGLTWADSSARIREIEDVRAVGDGWGNYRTYAINYDNDPTLPHITSIVSWIGSGESYTFGLSGLQTLASPFDGSTQGSAQFLRSVTINGLNLTHQFETNGSGELTKVTFPYGGYLRWDYANQTYIGGRVQREVGTRYLSKDGTAGAERAYVFSHDGGDAGRACHWWRRLQRPNSGGLTGNPAVLARLAATALQIGYSVRLLSLTGGFAAIAQNTLMQISLGSFVAGPAALLSAPADLGVSSGA